MKKEEFFQAMDELFANCDINEIRRAIDDIKGEWLRAYWHQKSEGYAECEECGAMVKLSECRMEKTTEPLEIATLEIYQYYCPECGGVAMEEGAFV